MIAAVLLAAAAATSSPAPGVGVGPPTNPKAANSHAAREFSGAYQKPIKGTAPPLLKKSAPAMNIHATANPLLRKAAPGASTGPAGRHALHEFSGATTPAGTYPGMGNGSSGRWGWAGLFGIFGLLGFFGRRRY